ncbi:MAG: YcaO-like family protein [Labilithrix sp.]|nr:YcaO-like family protein [Labilithrix sp.]
MLRLPEGWSAPERCEDVIVADGLAVRRAGVASVAPDGEEITGSAASLEHDGPPGEATPASRSWFELLERASVVEALRAPKTEHELRTAAGVVVRTCAHGELFPESDDPTRWRPARSNGVAIHADWSRACQRALWELAERDRVLASWYGYTRPERIDGEVAEVAGATASYEWSAWAFPEESRAGSFSRGLEVVGVFGFPTRPAAPLALGFAARPDRRAAVDAATREAIQLLAFLWGEPIAEPAPRVEPTAMGHLDFHQARSRHPQLRAWLAGEHVRYVDERPHGAPRRHGASAEASDAGEVLFADLTPAWLSGGPRVAKAVCTAAHRLVFGESPFGAHLPAERRIHPIS